MKKEEEDFQFTTVAHLLTALLTELRDNFVVEDNKKHERMRERIAQTMTMVNSYQELSNLIIKNNPYHSTHKKVLANPSIGVR